MWRDMRSQILVFIEYIMLEDGGPGLPISWRTPLQINQRQHQAVKPGVDRIRGTDRTAPPIIDQDIACLQRLDMMPPQRWYVERIARLQFSRLSCLQRIFKLGKLLGMRKFKILRLMRP